jgi:RNA polymerase sigma-70 factor (ECF subfamily)
LIRAVTLSACREHLRQAGRRKDVTVEPVEEGVLDEVDALLDVRRAVVALGEPCRTTIELHFYEDLTQAQVAERLHVAPGTIAARLSRCVRRLRTMLQERSRGSTSSG